MATWTDAQRRGTALSFLNVAVPAHQTAAVIADILIEDKGETLSLLRKLRTEGLVGKLRNGYGDEFWTITDPGREAARAYNESHGHD